MRIPERVHNRNQSLLLLAGEIFLIFTSAFWTEGGGGGLWLTLFYAVFFCAGGYALAHTRKWLVSYTLLALGALVFQQSGDHPILSILHVVCLSAALFLLFIEIPKHSFIKKNVSKIDRITAGIAGYLLLGIFWTMPVSLTNQISPGSIINQVSGMDASQSELLYFSFVTLTTLGYGDLVPTNPLAKMMSIFVCLSGVLYLAVFISALIGSPKEPHT